MINRTIGQTRSKRNSVSVELKKRGVTLPQLNRMETVGSSSLAYDEVANLVKSYVNEDTLLANLKDS
jgi:lambda repressor-like predicted transcriptional regulator